MGGGVPQVLPRLRVTGVRSKVRAPRGVEGGVRDSFALASRRAASERSSERFRCLPDQGEHQPEREAHLPRPGRAVVREDPNRHLEGGAVVLFGGGGSGGGVAAREAITLVRGFIDDRHLKRLTRGERCNDIKGTFDKL